MPSAPVPLVAAAVLTGLQGVALLVYAVLELVHLSSGGAAVGVTTALFFGAYAAALLCGAVGLFRTRSWVRSPVVVTELIGLLLAYDLFGGDTRLVAVAVGLVALAVLACLFHPATSAALSAP